MAGGDNALRGENRLARKMKDGSLRWVNVGGTKEVNLNAGDRIAIHTPGGGGYGKKAVKTNGIAPKVNGNGIIAGVKAVLGYTEPATRANGSLSALSSQIASSF